MGITVHYRGSLADLSRVEDFHGRDPEEAFQAAIEEVVPQVDWDDDEQDDEATAAWIAEMNEACRAAVEEPWEESVSEAAGGDLDEPASAAGAGNGPVDGVFPRCQAGRRTHTESRHTRLCLKTG